MQYRPEIDGLRALAIIPVVLFHGGFSLVSGGFVGVDIFFVISGYLITLLIYNDLSNNSFSPKRFYERRIKRLFPALFFVTVCCSIAAWFLYQPYDLEDFYGNLASVFAFASNVHFYHHSGYFDPSSELNSLLHTWSLSVEEQFYFVFPWLLILAFKMGRKAVWIGVFALIIVSFCLAEWRLESKPMAAFYLLYARGWELMIGSLCALLISDSNLITKVSKAHKEYLAWLGLCLILFSIFFFNDATPTAGSYTLIPTLGAALIILFSHSNGYLGRLLSHRLLVFIGLLSYSTYLWHQPLLAFSKYYLGENFDLGVSAALCLLSFFLGYLSWRFIEKPFRYGFFGFSRQRRVYITFATLSICIVTLSTYGKNERGFPERLDVSVRSIYQTTGEYEQVEKCFVTVSGTFDLSQCLETKTGYKNALIIGDSHAASLFPVLKREFAKQHWNLSMLAYARCVPFINEQYLQKYKFDSRFYSKHITPRCKTVKDSFKTGVKNNNFDLVIVLNHYNNWMGDYENHSFPEFWDMYIETVVEHFGKEKLLILGSLPIWMDDLPKLIVKDYVEGEDFTEPSFTGLFDKERNLDRFMIQDLEEREIRFLSSMAAFCSLNGCKRTGLSESGKIIAMAYDNAHLSPAGSQALTEHIISSTDSLLFEKNSLASDSL